MKRKKLLAALLGLMIAGTSMLSVCPSAAYRSDPDPNGDGEFDILDVINVSKYLHLQGTLKDWAQADMDGDGQVDVFDLSLMLRELVWKNREMPVMASRDLATNVQAASPETVTLGEDFSIGQTRFALDLLRESAEEGENALVSPYSVAQALGMTANGAAGETLAEMENVLGGSLDTLNSAFYSFRGRAQNDDKAKLSTANAIWVREGYPVSEAFLQRNADYYDAGAYAAPFDESTVEDINSWVNDKTDRMIPEILSEIPDLTEIILVNAVAFDAKWYEPYDEYALHDATFTAADGTKQEAVLMYGTCGTYLSDDHAEGFMKYYQGGRYAFAALLPEEGMSPEEYLAGLTPEGLYTMFSEPDRNSYVETALPKFSCDFSTTLNEPLANMGMPSAFDSDMADFSGMTEVPNLLYISDVLHKTYIEVTPEGTRAGAATAVMVSDCCEPIIEKEVILDRPFVYAIVDTQTAVPIFIGTLNSVE